jgi:hypothetical protein
MAENVWMTIQNELQERYILFGSLFNSINTQKTAPPFFQFNALNLTFINFIKCKRFLYLPSLKLTYSFINQNL